MSTEEGEDKYIVRFRVEKLENIYTVAGLACRVLRNDEPVGMIRLRNRFEFEWLKRRLEGDFDLEREEVRDEQLSDLRRETDGGKG